MQFDNMVWAASLEEIKRGYVYIEAKAAFVCLACGQEYERGIIYDVDGRLMEAGKAMAVHIREKHGSVFEYLLGMDKKYTGLTEHQKMIAQMFYTGVPDGEIAQNTETSTSTIRNQRFTFREKAKQAKIYLALMELLESRMSGGKDNAKDRLVPVHRGATMVDERYTVTEAEREKILKTYFAEGEKLKLKIFPTKEKRKIIVLQKIVQQFDPSRKYAEKEVNTIIGGIFDDFATIRRYLIEYGFMERTTDCRAYWLKK